MSINLSLLLCFCIELCIINAAWINVFVVDYLSDYCYSWIYMDMTLCSVYIKDRIIITIIILSSSILQSNRFNFTNELMSFLSRKQNWFHIISMALLFNFTHHRILILRETNHKLSYEIS